MRHAQQGADDGVRRGGKRRDGAAENAVIARVRVFVWKSWNARVGGVRSAR